MNNSVFRYYAILHPLRQSGFVETKGVLVLVMVWLIGSLISLPNLIHTRTSRFKYGNELYLDCREEWNGNGAQIVRHLRHY